MNISRWKADFKILRSIARGPGGVDVPAVSLLPSLDKAIKTRQIRYEDIDTTKREFSEIRTTLLVRKAQFDLKIGLRGPDLRRCLLALRRMKALPHSPEVERLRDEATTEVRKLATRESVRLAQVLRTDKASSFGLRQFLEWVYYSRKPLSYFSVSIGDIVRWGRTLPESDIGRISHALSFWEDTKIKWAVLFRSILSG